MFIILAHFRSSKAHSWWLIPSASSAASQTLSFSLISSINLGELILISLTIPISGLMQGQVILLNHWSSSILFLNLTESPHSLIRITWFSWAIYWFCWLVIMSFIVLDQLTHILIAIFLNAPPESIFLIDNIKFDPLATK